MSESDPTQTVPAPAAPTVDVEAIKADLIAQFDAKMNERISGIQSSYQTQINERDELIRQLQAAQMSEEEREQLEVQEQQEYVSELEARAWLLEKAQGNAKAAELFQKVLGYEDPEEQFKFFEELASQLSSPAPEAAAQPEPEAQVPDSDPNNPATFYGTPGAEVLTLGGKTYTNDQIDEMLKGMTSWPSQ